MIEKGDIYHISFKSQLCILFSVTMPRVEPWPFWISRERPLKWKLLKSMTYSIYFQRVALTFKSVVLFIMLYKVVLTFKSVDETLVCDHSNESYWAVLSFGTVYYAVQGGSNFQVCGWNPSVWPFKWKLLSINAVQGGSVKLSSLWMKLYRVTIQMKVLLSSTNCVLTLFNKSAIKNTVQKSPASVGVV